MPVYSGPHAVQDLIINPSFSYHFLHQNVYSFLLESFCVVLKSIAVKSRGSSLKIWKVKWPKSVWSVPLNNNSQGDRLEWPLLQNEVMTGNTTKVSSIAPWVLARTSHTSILGIKNFQIIDKPFIWTTETDNDAK